MLNLAHGFFTKSKINYGWELGPMTVCQVLSPMTPELKERGNRGGRGRTEKRTSLRSLPFETGALSPLLKCVLSYGIMDRFDLSFTFLFLYKNLLTDPLYEYYFNGHAPF